MSAFQEILRLARAQSEAVAHGDLETAIRLLQDRAALLQQAGPASAEDEDAIREVLRRDRDLSGAIRERMLAIRAQARELQQGRAALAGYAPPPRQLGLLDASR